jgi:hypothetical protein
VLPQIAHQTDSIQVLDPDGEAAERGDCALGLAQLQALA